MAPEQQEARWEFVVDSGDHGKTKRLPVPGGWLYQVITVAKQAALCFVPDAAGAAARERDAYRAAKQPKPDPFHAP